MQDKNIKILINFAERFSSLISESKMTQREVADAIGITQSAVNHYKSGRSEPKSMELYKISKLFGVSIEWLLTGEEVPVSTPETQVWRDRALVAEQKLEIAREALKGVLKKI